MKNWLIALFAAAALAGCGGGGSDPAPARVAASNLTVPANANVASAFTGTPFVFSGGVADFGTVATTTVVVTGTGTTPTFSITEGARVASGFMTFGSCIFNVTSSNIGSIPVGSAIRIDPCTISANTQGQVAGGAVAGQAGVTLLLGATRSVATALPFTVDASGVVRYRDVVIGQVNLVAVTGGS